MAATFYDVIILGTGPAGLQAAIHAVRRKVSVLVLGKRHKSSAYGAHIENYCCVHGDAGADMLEEGYQKVLEMGAEFMDADATEIDAENGRFRVTLETGDTIEGSALIIAMGISRNKLGVPGEKELLGQGVSYCVDCDAGFFKNEKVAMVGCESAAVSSALTLLFYASEVHLVCKELQVAPELAEKLSASDIIVHEGRAVTGVVGGDAGVQSVTLDDGSAIDVSGVFIELGAKGATDFAMKLGVALDSESMKYIDTNKKQETSVQGIYAAGDICGPPWQVAKAVGEGCVAGLEAAAYAKKRREQT